MLRQRDTLISSTLLFNIFSSLNTSSINIININTSFIIFKKGQARINCLPLYSLQLKIISYYYPLPQQFLYFFPEPQEHSSFLPGLASFLVGSFLMESS